MPRRAARVDQNHAEIVLALRAVGASVISLAAVGDGCGDILVGFRDVTYLLEIKTPRGKLTPAQRELHLRWQGQLAVVRTVEEALVAIGAIAREEANECESG